MFELAFNQTPNVRALTGQMTEQQAQQNHLGVASLRTYVVLQRQGNQKTRSLVMDPEATKGQRHRRESR